MQRIGTDEVVLNVSVAVTVTQRLVWTQSWTPCNITKEFSRKNVSHISPFSLEMHHHQDARLTRGLVCYWILLPNSMLISFSINSIGKNFVVIYAWHFLCKMSRSWDWELWFADPWAMSYVSL